MLSNFFIFITKMFGSFLRKKGPAGRGGYLTRGAEKCTIAKRFEYFGSQAGVAAQPYNQPQEAIYFQTGRE